ncbi:MAG: site-2 protease family protein [Planctomycetota bacterium JB042]
MSWWVQVFYDHHGPAYVVSWLFWVVFSVVLHELAHGWAALRCGDPTPELTGHMTWNPLVHMGGMSLAALALVGIAWGAMPVDPSRFRRAKDDALVAFAGPATNLLLAAFCLVAGALWIRFGGGATYDRFADFFFLGLMLNVALALFNLLPLPPLDGATVLATYSSGFRRLVRHPNFANFSLLLFLVVFLKLGPMLFSFAGTAANGSLGFLTRLIG